MAKVTALSKERVMVKRDHTQVVVNEENLA